MNNLRISKEQAKKYLNEYVVGKYVPGISFMFENDNKFYGVNNSLHEFKINSFTNEEDCINWLESEYTSQLNESNNNYPKLREWMTMAALMQGDAQSNFTKKHQAIRKYYYNGANKNTKLTGVNYNTTYDTLTFTFKTTATMKAHDKDYKPQKVNPNNRFKLEPNPEQEYTMMIQIVDFLQWLKGTRPDGIGKITWREIKDVLEVAYVRVWCNCGSFHWFGLNYHASNLDAAIYPTNIPDKKWNAIHGDYACLCKHLGQLFRSMEFFYNPMASAVQKLVRVQNL